MNELLDSCTIKVCENCQEEIKTEKRIDCILKLTARFCTESCEQEFEIETRDRWS